MSVDKTYSFIWLHFFMCDTNVRCICCQFPKDKEVMMFWWSFRSAVTDCRFCCSRAPRQASCMLSYVRQDSSSGVATDQRQWWAAPGADVHVCQLHTFIHVMTFPFSSSTRTDQTWGSTWKHLTMTSHTQLSQSFTLFFDQTSIFIGWFSPWEAPETGWGSHRNTSATSDHMWLNKPHFKCLFWSNWHNFKKMFLFSRSAVSEYPVSWLISKPWANSDTFTGSDKEEGRERAYER